MNREKAYNAVLEIAQERKVLSDIFIGCYHSMIKLANKVKFEFFDDSLLVNFGKSNISLYYKEIEDIRNGLNDEDGFYIDGPNIRYFFVSFKKEQEDE